jgi:lipopolysaccharide/colanic/teichoic acid biosynthesis glycosyltransferase
MAKRTVDVLGAAFALALLLPLIATIAIAIWLRDGMPVLFRQVRVGRNGREFVLIKFRSMGHTAGASITVAGDNRITSTGRILRKYKLDELPQLWNVLVGDMSLVGPRPEVPKFVDLGDLRWREVLRVRPGITDPASIVFRSEEEMLVSKPEPEKYYVEKLLPEKLSLSLCYIAERSIMRDLRIIILTAVASAAPIVAHSGRLRHLIVPRSCQ